MKLKNKIQTALLVAVVLLAACTKPNNNTLPYYHTADFSPIWAKDEKVNIDTLHTIAPFSFTNQNNQSVSNTTLADKIYAANFFFTTCGSICPKMTNNLHTVADSFAGNSKVNIVSFSVTPQTDDVATLKAYEKEKNINGSQWHLLTGNTSQIYTLARKSYFAEEEPGYNKDSTEFLHTEHCVLVDGKGHIRGVYNATIKLEMKRLIEDINILLKEE